MCGICGFTGQRDDRILRSMADSIVHRGPDEDGTYADDRVSLGIRRLSIIDVDTGHQPIHNEDKTVWVVFNGEIYNFQDLRTALTGKGHIFSTDHSDTEVIVHLYEEYGKDFVHHLNGMFAIALWDKNKGALLLIRDRMGVKPLFYLHGDNRLVFASEIKAILKYPQYRAEMNYDAVYHYFSFKNIPAPMTAFKGIYALLPGEMLSCSRGAIQKRRWWKIRFKENKEYDQEFVKKKILHILEDATRLRMISDVPFGAYLSGGLDSSAVVALMARHSERPIKTFSLGYEDKIKNKENDLFFARKIAQAYKTEHYEYIMTHKEMIDSIEDIIGSFDQPFSGTISTYFLTKLIAKHVKVALSGDGADELFGSYLSHRVAQPMSYFCANRHEIASGRISEQHKKYLAPCNVQFLEDLFNKSQGDEAAWRYHLYVATDEEKKALLSPDFYSQMTGSSTRSLLKGYFAELSARDPLNRILEMEWNTQLPDQVLAFVDFLSMAHSVEIRSPFLDYRLVEFVAGLPGSMKIRYGNVKDILKRSCEQLLPGDITTRPKEGFVLPIFDWMNGHLKGYCESILSEQRLKKHHLFNIQAVNDLFARYWGGEKSVAGKIWNCMMFQVWWEKYFG